MKFIYKYFLPFLFVLNTACDNSVIKEDSGYSFNSDSIQYRIEFYSSRCVRILSMPLGDTLVTKRLVIDASKPRFNQFDFDETFDKLIFKTKDLYVIFDKNNSAFTFRNSLSEIILQEKDNKQARIFKRQIVDNENCLDVTQRFVPSKDEAIYGLGQYQNGVINYRNQSVKLLQSNMDIVNPFLISTAGYGILWDNYSSTVFEDNIDGFYFKSEVGDASDYYFVYGGTMDNVVSEYRDLTGKTPMFGKWAYGFWQSKERYKSFDELKSVVKEYRKRSIPIDNIVQDWEYWGNKSNWNSLKFDKTNFDNPKQIIKELQDEDNVKVMLSVWPGFGPQTEIYKSLDSIGALFDVDTWAGYKVFDAYNPEARDIFWKYLKSGLHDQGVDAWWMDATEPSFKEGFTQLKQEEKTKSAGKTYLGSFHRYLNTYSLEMMKDFYQRLRTENEEKRAFILTRSAFASQQRYATAVWSGDVSASWDNMHKQLAAGINLSMSGIPYWTSDIGGFFVSDRDACYPNGLKDDDYKELYSRWFQFGCFTPLFRAHGTDVPREVWQFGNIGNSYYENQIKYINLRYRLLPYIYSMAYKVYSENYTMLRGLAMDFVNDNRTYDIDNSYMFGSAFLVRPVFQSRSDAKIISTYLPKHEGEYWFDYWTSQPIKCNEEHIKLNILDEMPLYVKGGTILPLANVKQYAMEYQDSEIDLRIYAGTDAEFMWYDDEGDSYRYETGYYSKVMMHWDDDDKILALSKREGKYENMPETVKMNIKLFTTDGECQSKQTEYNGNELTIKF